MLEDLVFSYLISDETEAVFGFFLAMDSTSCVLMVVACILGSYGNKINFRSHFNGNLDNGKEKSTSSENTNLPQFSREHGHMERGNV